MPRWTEAQLEAFKKDRNSFAAKNAKKGKGQAYKGSNQLTKAVQSYLAWNGFDVWRNNTMAPFDPYKAAAAIASFILEVVKQPGKWNKQNLTERLKKILYNCFRANVTEKGVSDLLGVHKKTGTLLAVEIKHGKDSLRPEQEAFLRRMKKAGAIAFVATSVKDVENNLHEFLKDLEKSGK